MDRRVDDAIARGGVEELPLALARLHARLAVGAAITMSFAVSTFGSGDGNEDRLRCLLEGGGFAVESSVARAGAWHVALRRRRTLPDFVGPGLRLLIVGLNPSLHAADAGVGFSGPGNRFWPAALAAGLVNQDRDPVDALVTHRVGMTDLVKRATRSAKELRAEEYRDGLVRVERLCSWFGPRAVCVAGLTGWRQAADRRARPGVQSRMLAGAPVYVMPNPSGLNAHDTVASLAAHLRAAVSVAP